MPQGRRRARGDGAARVEAAAAAGGGGGGAAAAALPPRAGHAAACPAGARVTPYTSKRDLSAAFNGFYFLTYF